MDRVVTECARHLIAELSFDTCIDIRSLPGINKNKNFVQEVDTFIFKEVSWTRQIGDWSSSINLFLSFQFEKVSKTPDFLALSNVQIEVLYQSKPEMALVTEHSLCRLVLDWVKRQVKEDNLSVSSISIFTKI
jgi:influenza virus NS1A-binding protein